jgi:O-acetyl-ADP-ribose deacetylase (regulator of RNase III)
VWRGGRSHEAQLLASCYRRCIEIASAEDVATIAFPSISTGVYGYPKAPAARIAVETVRVETSQYPCIREVVFCCFSDEDLAIYKAAMVG